MIEPTTDFLRAKTAAEEHGLSLCGTFHDGRPLYFLVEPDATEDHVREAAFEAKHGRTMTDGELRLLAIVKDRRPDALAATLEDLP